MLARAEVQRRAAPIVLSGSDAVIQSETGSGKTAAFLLPALSRLTYPPQVFPDDMKGALLGLGGGRGRRHGVGVGMV